MLKPVASEAKLAIAPTLMMPCGWLPKTSVVANQFGPHTNARSKEQCADICDQEGDSRS